MLYSLWSSVEPVSLNYLLIVSVLPFHPDNHELTHPFIQLNALRQSPSPSLAILQYKLQGNSSNFATLPHLIRVRLAM